MKIPVLSIISFFIGVFFVLLSNSNVRADGIIYWEGNGSGNLPCEYGGLWILAPAQDVTSAVLTVNGGSYDMTKFGNNWKASSDGYLAEPIDAYVTYTGDAPDAHLQLSHCEPSNPTQTPTSPSDTPTATMTSTITSTPVTPTPTVSNTPTSTATNTPTETRTPTNTPTRTATYVTNTPTITSTGTQPTSTATDPATQTPTSTSTSTETSTPTSTTTSVPTETQTQTPTPTPLDTSTATPKPPAPAVAYKISNLEYVRNNYLGTAVIDEVSFILYKGVSDSNGTLFAVYGNWTVTREQNATICPRHDKVARPDFAQAGGPDAAALDQALAESLRIIEELLP